MDLTTRLLEPDPDRAREEIRALEESRWYEPDTDYEDRLFDTVYGLDVRPSGRWKYDHRLGTHSILYDPEDERFEVRMNGPLDLLRGAASTLLERLDREDTPREGTERFGYLLEDGAIDEYRSLLQDSDLAPDADDGSTVYRGDEATVRVTERDVPERDGRYADVEVEISDGGTIPGGEFLLERQRSVSFDGELDATLHYLDTPTVDGDIIDRRQ